MVIGIFQNQIYDVVVLKDEEIMDWVWAGYIKMLMGTGRYGPQNIGHAHL